VPEREFEEIDRERERVEESGERVSIYR